MRCPFCESVSGIVDSEAVECLDEKFVLMNYVANIVDEEPTYEFYCDVTEYECRDCGKSWWV